jgi:hypothetical protein
MASWKETLRSWLQPAPRKPVRRTERLEVGRLEDRITPVQGSFDVPYAVDFDTALGATDLTGVVNAGGSAGAMIDRGATVVGSRHVLTTASSNPVVGDTVSFYTRAADGTVKTISIPVVGVWIHPSYIAGTFANDIAILTLEAIAPQYAKDYPVYDGQAYGTEIGRLMTMAGFGVAGTGTSGPSFSDLQRLTVTATGGTYRLFSPTNGQTTAPIPYNATAAQIQAALIAIGQSVQVLNPSFGPFQNTVEIRYLTAANARELEYVRNPSDPLVNGGNNGTVDVETLTNGSNDGEFQRLTLNATAGFFRLGLGGVFTGQIPYNATDTQIEAALETIAGVTEVSVRQIPAGSPSGAGSFQISFNQPNGGFPVLTVDPALLTGTASAYILQPQGQPALRIGSNEYDGSNSTFLTYDFDTDGTDSFASPIPGLLGGGGDSGAPGFVDVGGGVQAIASLFSNAPATSKFTDIQLATRVSKYTSDISKIVDATGYAATVDMQYQLGGNDGIADTFRVTQTPAGLVQIYVKDSKAGPERLFYQDAAANMASVVLRGTNDDDTFIIDSSVTVLVSIEGGGGKNSIVGPNLDTMWTITGADAGTGDTSTTDFNFKGIRNITGGTLNDTFKFSATGTVSGFIDGGAGVDTIDFSDVAATNVSVTATGATDGVVGTIAGSTPLAGQFRNMNNIVGAQFGTADAITGPATGGTWTHAGAGGMYVDSVNGKNFTYSNFETLNGNTGDDTFNVLSFTTNLVVNGGAGVNKASVDGTAGNDSVTLSYQTVNGAGALTGLAKTLSFLNLFSVNYDGKAGTNSYRFEDKTGQVRGTPTDPLSGIVFSPSGAAAGSIRVGTLNQFGVAGINNGLTVDGGSVGSVLTVTGTSDVNRPTTFGEALIGNGRDTITVTDTKVSVTSASAGDLLPIIPAYTLGSITFSTIYVAGGNENLNIGDVFNVTPSFNVRLLVDGQGPANTARPGDRVQINASAYTSAFVNDPAQGPPQTQITQNIDGAQVGLINIESGLPAAPGQGMIVVATDAGPLTTVQVFDRISQQLKYTLVPFEDFNLGATVASGDVNGDGVADVIVGAGPGGGPRVVVYSGADASLMYDFFAYEEEFRGGVNVSAGDFNGDGKADIVLGTGNGGGPRVRVLSGADLTPIRDVFAYESTFRGGVNVSTGDFTGDGVPDLITSAGNGGGPRVVVFSGTDMLQVASFFVFDPNSRTGFYAAGGDVNGDGYADVIAGAGAGAPAQIRVISGNTRTAIADFYVNDPLEPGTAVPSIQFDAGVRVAAADVNGDGIDDVLSAKGPGSLPTVRAYQVGGVNPITNALYPTLAEVAHFDAFDGALAYGLYIGGSN